MESEIRKLAPDGGKISPAILAKTTIAANSRIFVRSPYHELLSYLYHYFLLELFSTGMKNIVHPDQQYSFKLFFPSGT